MTINANTLPTFLIGHPVSHSKSPKFQNAAFEKVGINSTYLALDINPDDFDTILSGIKKLNIYGMNITLPYKKDIMRYTDSLSDDAKKIDAVNTIEVAGDKWIGHNTDWYGVFKTLENNKVSKKEDVFIIGAGGATPGVIFGLQKYGIKNISITNRTEDKAEALGSQFGISFCKYDNYKRELDNHSMIINCTSIHFNDIINKFDDAKLYFDLKYYSKKVKAKRYIDGNDMLLYQGAMSYSIWTKKNAPIDIMRKALLG